MKALELMRLIRYVQTFLASIFLARAFWGVVASDKDRLIYVICCIVLIALIIRSVFSAHFLTMKIDAMLIAEQRWTITELALVKLGGGSRTAIKVALVAVRNIKTLPARFNKDAQIRFFVCNDHPDFTNYYNWTRQRFQGRGLVLKAYTKQVSHTGFNRLSSIDFLTIAG